MEKFSKAIIIFLLLLFSACEKYYVGNITIAPSELGKIDKFNYHIYNDRIIIKGKINQEIFVGDLFPVEVVRKIESLRNPNIKRSIINEKNQLSIARLIGSKNNIIECFVKQKNIRTIKNGDKGICYYLSTGDAFDIQFEKL